MDEHETIQRLALVYAASADGASVIDLGEEPDVDAEEVIQELRNCQTIFLAYAQQHRDKETPEAELKARTNEAHARRIRDLLDRIGVPRG